LCQHCCVAAVVDVAVLFVCLLFIVYCWLLLLAAAAVGVGC